LITIVGMVVLTIGLWFGLPLAMRSAQNRRIKELCKRKKLIALTFDDGPWFNQTEIVLDMLDELGVKATFFMIGSLAQKNESLARRVAEKGHQIGGHTQNHLDAWRVGPIRGARDCRTGMQTLKDRELPVSWFRPPKGNATLGTVLSCWRQGCRMIWWTHDSGDTGYGAGISNLRVSQLLGKVLPGKKKMMPKEELILPESRKNLLLSLEETGGVVLLHDGNRTHEEYKTLTLDCTRDIVRRAKEKGFRFVTLDELN
jgi:peptidoglycan/xylan/chitin deacetylase (PgdA/CDA1 family)